MKTFIQILLLFLVWTNRALFVVTLVLTLLFTSSNKCEDANGIPFNDYTNYNFEYYVLALMFNLSLFFFALLERKNRRLRYLFLILSVLLLVGGIIYRFYIPCPSPFFD